MDSSQNEGRTVLTEFESLRLLAGYGLRTPAASLASSPEEVAAAVGRLRPPVVLKIQSPAIVHKSAVGGVALGVDSAEAAVAAYERIRQAVAANRGSEAPDTVLVAEQAPEGALDLFFGAKRDRVFGPVFLVGVGGIWVEAFDDVAVLVPPLSEAEVKSALAGLRAHKLIERAGPQVVEHVFAVLQILERVLTEEPRIAEVDLNPVRLFADGGEPLALDATVVLAATGPTPAGGPRRPNAWPAAEAIEALLHPRSVAVIGASPDRSVGGMVLSFLLQHGFGGSIYPVNPKYEEIRGLRCYARASDIPAPVDLACVAVPAGAVADVLLDCDRKGIKTAIVFSSGFGEAGESGRDATARLEDALARTRIRIVGPNTIGTISTPAAACTAFAQVLQRPQVPAGEAAFITQSGALGSCLLGRAWEEQLGFRYWVASGNEADLTLSDYLDYFVRDEAVKVIGLFIESVRDGAAFQAACRRALELGKPIVAFKSGRTEVGGRATRSHTGAIAGDDRVYDAVFRKHAVVRVDEFFELKDVVMAFAWQPLPGGNRIGVLSTSGGACSILADELTRHGLELPPFSPEVSARIAEAIPSFGAAQNPVDTTAQVITNPAIYRGVLEAILADDRMDALIVQLTTNADPGASVAAETIVAVSRLIDKPILVARAGPDSLAPRALEVYRTNRIPLYASPNRVALVMARMVHYALRRRRLLERARMAGGHPDDRRG
ncbi:MAG TPA: acetate--CoA ligase family protein [Bacillota bacterium]